MQRSTQTPRIVLGNRYIIVITDLYGKWLVIQAVPNEETATGLRVIVDEWFCKFGIPNKS